MQAHRGLGWSSAQPPSRRASLLSHQAARFLSHTRARALGRQNSGTAQLRRCTRGASGPLPRAPNWCWRREPGVWRAAARAPMNLRGASARVRGRSPPPWRAPQGERAPRAGARTKTELYYLAPSRASLLSGHSNSFPTSPAKDFPPLSLVAVRPSVPEGGGEGGGGGRKAERGKSKSLSLPIRPRILL